MVEPLGYDDPVSSASAVMVGRIGFAFSKASGLSDRTSTEGMSTIRNGRFHRLVAGSEASSKARALADAVFVVRALGRCLCCRFQVPMRAVHRRWAWEGHKSNISQRNTWCAGRRAALSIHHGVVVMGNLVVVAEIREVLRKTTPLACCILSRRRSVFGGGGEAGLAVFWRSLGRVVDFARSLALLSMVASRRFQLAMLVRAAALSHWV
jgi:hypothetical protein